MFKKSLIAVAVFGAVAFSAQAADVTLYGVVDLGLNYQNQKIDGQEGVDTFQMYSGQNSGSRFGLKGTEDLGNGMQVGFVLENGFSADDGKLGQGNRLFGREANVFLTGTFGTFSMGRVGALSSGVGSYNVVYGYVPFGSGWGDFTGAKGEFMLADRDRFDNTVTYVTPNFSGLTGYAQYSFQADGQEDAHSTNNKRYAALGAKYDIGAFSTGLVVDTVMNKANSANKEDSLGVTWGASYDLNVVKLFGLAQYGKNENKLGGFDQTDLQGGDEAASNEGFKGYALALGVTAPVYGGTFLAQINYTDGESENSFKGGNYTRTAEFDRWGIATAYEYPLSKRTKVYTYAGYNEGTLDDKGVNDMTTVTTKTKTTEFGLGMVHKF